MGKFSTTLLRVFLTPLVILSPLFINLQAVVADRDMIGPSYVTVEESGQVAIVAWNGREEVLILSTNVRASKSTLVLEVLPLPSNPTKVVEGNFESFKRIAELINRKRIESQVRGSLGDTTAGGGAAEGGLEVTFQEKVGTHDITVVKVNDQDHFSEWVAGFAKSKGVEFYVTPNFREAVSEYLRKGIRHVVFDMVEIDMTTRSTNPLVYRFQTGFLYYPLRITADSSVSGLASSKVNLFLISKGQIDKTVSNIRQFGLVAGFDHPIKLNKGELSYVTPELADLFEGNPFVMNAYYYGPLNKLRADLMINAEDLHVPTWLETFAQKPIFVLWRFTPFPPIWAVVLGIVAWIHLIAKVIKRIMRSLMSKRWIQGLLSYSIPTIVVALVVFSDAVRIVVYGTVLFAIMGFASTVLLSIFLILKIAERRGHH